MILFRGEISGNFKQPQRVQRGVAVGKEMVSYMSVLIYGVGGIVMAGMAFLVAFQEKLVYVPVLPGLTKSYSMTPARLRLIYEDVWLRSSDGVNLHAWFVKLLPDCRGPTILFFQENAGNIAHRLEMIQILLQRLHCNVFMLSYRGYGQAALDHLIQRTDIDTSRIVIFGRSLGERERKHLESANTMFSFIWWIIVFYWVNSGGQHLTEDAECCICLCSYDDGSELRELPCRHHFHCACIDKWLYINATCPLCKFNILKNGNVSGSEEA